MKQEKIPIWFLIQQKRNIQKAIKEGLDEYFSNLKRSLPPVDDFLSADQAAKYLKIQLSTLYSKVEKGEIPYYRSGKRKLLFDTLELKEYIKNKKS